MRRPKKRMLEPSSLHSSKLDWKTCSKNYKTNKKCEKCKERDNVHPPHVISASVMSSNLKKTKSGLQSHSSQSFPLISKFFEQNLSKLSLAGEEKE